MKKSIRGIIVFCIALSMALQSNCAAVYAENINFNIPDKCEMVFNLGILDRSSFALEETLTRAQAVDAILKFANLPLSDDVAQYFIDVPPEHPYAQQINAGVLIGFISQDVYFRPDEKVTLSQMVKFIMTVCGYEVMAQVNGGYPVGYSSLGLRKGLLTGVDSSDATNNANILKILMNGLEMEIVQQYVYGMNIKLKTEREITMLSVAHKIYKHDGTVTNNPNESVSGSDFVMIDNVMYDTDNFSMPDYMGYAVDAYYKLDNHDVRLLNYVYPKTKNKVEIFNLQDIVSFNNHVLTINHGDKEIKLDIDPKASVIYNNEQLDSYTENDFLNKYGIIELVDNRNSSTYNTVKITSVITMPVSTVDLEKEIIYGRQAGQKVDISNERKLVKLKNFDGNSVSLSDISESSIVSVAESVNGMAVTVIMSKRTVSGKVTEINDSDTVRTVVIGGNECKVSPFYTQSFQLEQDCIVYLDSFGGVAHVSIAPFISGVVYLVKAQMKKGMSGNIEMKVFTANGEMKIVDLAKNAVIDGEARLAEADILLRLAKRQVLVVKINERGEVNFVDTKVTTDKENAETALIQKEAIQDNLELRYKTSTKAFSNKMLVDDEAVFFLIPSESEADQDDLYEIIGTNYFRNDGYYKIASYYMGINKGMCDVVVVQLKNETTVGNDTSMLIVTKVTRILDNDNIEKVNIYGYQDSKSVEMMVSSQSVLDSVRDNIDSGKIVGYTPMVGDVLKVATNSKNQINIIDPIYTRSDDKFWIASNPSADNFDNVLRIVNGYVYLKSDTVIIATTKDPVFGISSGDFAEYYNLEKFKIYKCYDSGASNVRVEECSISEIYDYVHNGVDRSKVIFNTRYGEPKTMVVFK